MSQNRRYFILWMWRHVEIEGDLTYRGCLETADGRQHFFQSLAELNHHLLSLGWVEAIPPASIE